MDLLRMRLRSEWRSGWGSIVALVLLIGVAGGAVLAAAAGARRTDSTVERTLDRTLAADVLVSPDDTPDPSDWAAIDTLPQVEVAAEFQGVLAAEVDDEGFPDLAHLIEPITIASLDDSPFRAIDRHDLVDGRYADPTRADEMVISEAWRRRFGTEVGDRFALRFFNVESIRASLGADPPTVPEGIDISVHVVGIVLPLDEAVRPIDDPRRFPYGFFTPALWQRVADLPPLYGGKAVRLRNGAADLATFEAAVRERMDVSMNFQETATTADRARRAVQPYVVALWLFAALGALAAVVIVGQAVSRAMRHQLRDASALSALGCTRVEHRQIAIARGVLLGGAGAAVAVIVAASVSPLTPIGPLRPLEPNRGIDLDPAVLIPGAVGVALLGVVGTLAGLRRFDRPTSSRRSASMPVDLPVSVAVGARFALDAGHGNRVVPVRSTLFGVTLALVAIAATLVFGAGLTSFTSTPQRYGWTWDAQVIMADPDPATVTARLAADTDVAAIAPGGYGQFGIEGRTVSAIGVEPVDGVPSIPIVKGRAPRSRGEIVFGSTTARRLELEIGDSVEVDGGTGPRSFEVVGTGVFARFAPYPTSEPTGLGVGALVTLDGLARVQPGSDGAVGVGSGFYFVVAKPGSQFSIDALDERLFGDSPGDGSVLGPQRPNDVLSYDRLARTPYLLAGLLGLLGGGTAAHMLVTSVRGRRRDFAVLKTLGFTRRQLSVSVASQATALVLLSLVVALPLGVLAGRALWIRTAFWLGIADDVSYPWPALAAVALVAIIGTNAVAALPGRAAARTRAAEILRAE